MLLNKINIDLLKKEPFNLTTYKENIEKRLNNSGLLLKGYFEKHRYTSNGLFSENIWVTQNNVRYTHSYFLFNKLDKLIFKKVTSEEVILIKCWIAEELLKIPMDKEKNKYNRTAEMNKLYNRLVTFIDETSYFSKEYLDDTKGSKIHLFFINKNKRKYADAILIYINYIEDKVTEEKLKILYQYKKKINEILIKTQSDNKARTLPKSRDILLFDNYLNKFFYEDDVDENLKLFYMPILIWWKITIVIPMRPSEFCVGIKRDCLFQNDGNYYLKIERIKEKVNAKESHLPILNKLQITKELYDLINDYIDKTNEFGETNTLISYAAIYKLRNILSETSPYFNHRYKFKAETIKVNTKHFTITILDHLLSDFYNTIIYEMYKDNLIQDKILPGDTRHIAFTSLMLQGYSPVEIAIIGGHKNIQSLDNYTCSANTYINTEVMTLIRKNMYINNFNKRTLMDLISKMPSKCPSDNPIIAYINNNRLGYCTADFIQNPAPCESTDCYKCSKWWCEPNEINYIKLEKIVRDMLNQENDKLQRDIDFILLLFKKLGLKVIEGRLIADHEITQEIKRMSLQLNSRTNGIIHLKSQLISDDTNTENLIMAIDETNFKNIDKILDAKIIEEGDSYGEKKERN